MVVKIRSLFLQSSDKIIEIGVKNLRWDIFIITLFDTQSWYLMILGKYIKLIIIITVIGIES